MTPFKFRFQRPGLVRHDDGTETSKQVNALLYGVPKDTREKIIQRSEASIIEKLKNDFCDPQNPMMSRISNIRLRQSDHGPAEWRLTFNLGSDVLMCVQIFENKTIAYYDESNGEMNIISPPKNAKIIIEPPGTAN